MQKARSALLEGLAAGVVFDCSIRFVAGFVRVIYRRLQRSRLSGSLTLRSLGILNHHEKLSGG